MGFAYKLFPFCEVLTMISGKMVAKHNSTNMLFDFAQFMLNDNFFGQEARAEAPRLLMVRFLEVLDEVIEDLKEQFPKLVNYPIPEFAKDEHDPKISADFWVYLHDTTQGKLLVRSLDRY